MYFRLNVGANKLTSLPDWIGDLKQLTEWEVRQHCFLDLTSYCVSA